MEERGGYWDPDRITVARYDPGSQTRLDSFVYDEYIGASGLVVTNSSVWLNAGKGGLGGGEPHAMLQLDRASGEILHTMAAEGGEQDVAYDGTNLLVSFGFNSVHWIDEASGTLVKKRETPFPEGGTQRGIAHRPGEIWLASWTQLQLAVLDDDGAHIGVAEMPTVPHEIGAGLHMTFAGEQLAVASNGRVYLFDVRPAATD